MEKITTPANEWRGETKDKIYELLHNFHRECLKEPYEGQPLLRRARKNEYVDKIYSLLDTERARIVERIEGMKKETYATNPNMIYDTQNVGYNQALDQAIDIVNGK